MKSIYIRLAATLLIAVLFVYTCGFHFYYQLRLGQIKAQNNISEMENCKAYNLIAIEIPLEEISWVDEHEIYWRGDIYDIKEIQISDGKLKAFAYPDNEEEALNEDYKKNNPAGQSSSQKPKATESFLKSSIACEVRFTASNLNFEVVDLNAIRGYKIPFFPPPEA